MYGDYEKGCSTSHKCVSRVGQPGPPPSKKKQWKGKKNETEKKEETNER